MSISIILLFSFLNAIINIPSPIKINTSSPFYIISNEILFEFNYNSEEKTDIIFVFKPYSNGIIYGKIESFNNLELFKNDSLNNASEMIFSQTFFLKE